MAKQGFILISQIEPYGRPTLAHSPGPVVELLFVGAFIYCTLKLYRDMFLFYDIDKGLLSKSQFVLKVPEQDWHPKHWCFFCFFLPFLSARWRPFTTKNCALGFVLRRSNEFFSALSLMLSIYCSLCKQNQRESKDPKNIFHSQIHFCNYFSK